MRLFVPIILLIQSFAFNNTPVQTVSSSPASTRVDPLLCLPGVYTVDPLDCIPLGPSGYLTEMSALGMYLPLISLPAHPIDTSLGELPYSYALLGENQTKIYASLQDAIAGKNEIRVIEPGRLRYVSYYDYTDTPFGRFFQLPDGTWLSVSSRVSIPHSFPGGVELSRTPANSFGWILPFASSVETKHTPGYQVEDYTGHSINQYQMVQVYTSRLVNDEEWDLIAPDEWIEGRYVGMVTPMQAPPPGVENGRWIEVNLFE